MPPTASALAKQPSGWIEHWPLSRVTPAVRNPKRHHLAGIVASIRQFGYVAPVIENGKTGRLVAGHGRLEALQAILLEDGPKKPPRNVVVQKGEWCIPVLRGRSFESDAQAEAYILAANRLVELGGWDWDALAPRLEGLLDQKNDLELLAVGWPEKTIRSLLSETETSRGRTPADLAPGYNAGAMKSVVLYFKADEYATVLARIESVMAREKAATPQDALMAALVRYERDHRRK